MKSIYLICRIWIFVAISLFTFVSCGTDDAAEDAPEPIEVPVIASINVVGGESGSFTFEAPADWTLRVTKGSSWCSIESQYTSGAAGTQTIPFTTAVANEFDTEDTAEVTITFGTGDNTATTTFEIIRAARSRELVVTDAEGNELQTLTITTAELEDEVSATIFIGCTITANFDWSIKTQPSWLQNEGGETFSGRADEAVEVSFSATRTQIPVEAATEQLTIVDVNAPEAAAMTFPIAIEGFSAGYYTTQIDRNTINLGQNFTADGLLYGGHMQNTEGVKSYTITMTAADPANMPHLLAIYQNATFGTLSGDIVGSVDDQPVSGFEGAWLTIKKVETRATLEDNTVVWEVSAQPNEDVERQVTLFIIPADVYAAAGSDLQNYFVNNQRTPSGSECTIKDECWNYTNLISKQDGGKAEETDTFRVEMADYGMGHTCTDNGDGSFTIQFKRSGASYVDCTVTLPASWSYRTFKYYYATNWSSGFEGPFVFTNQAGDRKQYECDWVTATLSGSATEYKTKISVKANQGEAREYELVFKYQDSGTYMWKDAGKIIVKQPSGL